MGSRTVIDTSICRTFAVAACCLALGMVWGTAQAKTAYVTDRLQLGVHQQDDASDKPFTKLKSGERVETLEENRFHARVRIPDGRTGWVKKTYLVDEQPAVLRLTEVERERDRAVAALESVEAGLAEREARVGGIEQELAARESAAAAEAAELGRLRTENVALAGRLEAYAFSVPGRLFFVAVAASLGIGFLGAWWWFDRRSRRRHGGFRIH